MKLYFLYVSLFQLPLLGSVSWDAFESTACGPACFRTTRVGRRHGGYSGGLTTQVQTPRTNIKVEGENFLHKVVL